jgi:hypothetical protein
MHIEAHRIYAHRCHHPIDRGCQVGLLRAQFIVLANIVHEQIDGGTAQTRCPIARGLIESNVYFVATDGHIANQQLAQCIV